MPPIYSVANFWLLFIAKFLREMPWFQEQPKTIVNDLENRNTTEAQDRVLEIQNTRLREKIKKQSRTHALLVSIVVVFALSWFPLNLLNIILDVHNIFKVFFLSIITTV